MDNKHSGYTSKYNFFVSLFVAVVSLIFSICLVYIANGSAAMIQPMPKVLWGFLGVAFIALIFLIYNGTKMYTSRKDTRLDTLISNATILTAEVKNLKDTIDKLVAKSK